MVFIQKGVIDLEKINFIEPTWCHSRGNNSGKHVHFFAIGAFSWCKQWVQGSFEYKWLNIFIGFTFQLNHHFSNFIRGDSFSKAAIGEAITNRKIEKTMIIFIKPSLIQVDLDKSFIIIERSVLNHPLQNKKQVPVIA